MLCALKCELYITSQLKILCPCRPRVSVVDHVCALMKSPIVILRSVVFWLTELKCWLRLSLKTASNISVEFFISCSLHSCLWGGTLKLPLAPLQCELLLLNLGRVREMDPTPPSPSLFHLPSVPTTHNDSVGTVYILAEDKSIGHLYGVVEIPLTSLMLNDTCTLYHLL